MKCIVCGFGDTHNKRRYGVVHRFPRDKKRCKEWLLAIGKPENFYVAGGDGVCSQHFKDSEYRSLPDFLHRPMLRKDALPTLEQIFVRDFGAPTEYTEKYLGTSWSNWSYANEIQSGKLSFSMDFGAISDVYLSSSTLLKPSSASSSSFPNKKNKKRKKKKERTHTRTRDSGNSGDSLPLSGLTGQRSLEYVSLRNKRIQTKSLKRKTKSTETDQISTRDFGTQCNLLQFMSSPKN